MPPAGVFKGCTFCISGALSMKRNDFEALLKKNGGTVGSGVTKKTTHLITTPNEFATKTAKVQKALELGNSCSLVTEQFVQDSISANKLQDVKSYSVASVEASSPSPSSSSSSSSGRARPASSGGRGAGKAKRAKKEAPTNRNNAIWVVETGSPAFGIYVDDEMALCANDLGWLFAVDKESGEVKSKVKLPTGVKAIVRDRGGFLYAGCNDGSVYDCTRIDAPRLMKEPQERNQEGGGQGNEVLWADIYDGNLLISQTGGMCSLLNIEGEVVWSNKTGTPSDQAWTVRTNRENVFYSSGDNLVGLRFNDGVVLWKFKVPTKNSEEPSITFGVLHGRDTMFLSLSPGGVLEVKVDGDDCVPSDLSKWKYLVYSGSQNDKEEQKEDEDEDEDEEEDEDEDESIFYACAASDTHVFGASDSALFIFPRGDTSAASRKVNWDLGSCMSLQIHGDSLYAVTINGNFVRVPLSVLISPSSSSSIVTKTVVVDTGSGSESAVVPVETLETISSAEAKGVLVECVKSGGRLRIRVCSPGFNNDWNVQFPSNLREVGAKYVVEELLEAASGGYYRAKGDIKKISG